MVTLVFHSRLGVQGCRRIVSFLVCTGWSGRNCVQDLGFRAGPRSEALETSMGQSKTSSADDRWSGGLVAREPWVNDSVFGGLEVMGSVSTTLWFLSCRSWISFFVCTFVLALSYM